MHTVVYGKTALFSVQKVCVLQYAVTPKIRLPNLTRHVVKFQAPIHI
jgi:hypothetical protein